MNTSASPGGDWRGTRHARLTRSMLTARMPQSARQTLAALRYLLRDQETRCISHAGIAKKARLSEGSVSPAMRILAGEDPAYPTIKFIDRAWVADNGRGRAGYAITMLPPSELRQAHPPQAQPLDCSMPSVAAGFFDPEQGSSLDPISESPPN